jgi:hypothetical protein
MRNSNPIRSALELCIYGGFCGWTVCILGSTFGHVDRAAASAAFHGESADRGGYVGLVLLCGDDDPILDCAISETEVMPW